MSEGIRKPGNRFVHICYRRMEFRKQSFSFCPVGTPPHSCINCQVAEGRKPDTPFHYGPNNKRTYSYRQLAEFYIGPLYSNCIICCRNNSHTASHTFTLYASNDE